MAVAVATTRILDGKALAATLRSEMASEVAEAVASGKRPPGLAVILAGDDPASQVYVRNKQKACAETGIASYLYQLGSDTTQSELLELIAQLNSRPDVDGILLQLPLYPGLDVDACLQAIDPDKDVDGFHPVNMGRLTQEAPGFAPCTPLGVMELLKRNNLSVAGKKAVVVGRSAIVGKPLAHLLASRSANATVTLCHSGTPDLARECRGADFLFLAMGRPCAITGDMVKPGAVVVDIGINRTEDGLKGDADYASVAPVASAITPVPGGVGPMTIAMLLRNTLQSWKRRVADGETSA